MPFGDGVSAEIFNIHVAAPYSITLVEFEIFVEMVLHREINTHTRKSHTTWRRNERNIQKKKQEMARNFNAGAGCFNFQRKLLHHNSHEANDTYRMDMDVST